MSKKRKNNGHYCWACGRHRPNEKFSGKGHKNHLCKECSHGSKDKLNEISHTREVMGFWEQKSISKKNILRLEVLSKSSISDVAEISQVVLEVARQFPFKKKRIRRIVKEQQELMPKLAKVGLVYGWIDQEEYDGYEENCEFYVDLIEEEICCYEDDDPRNYEYHLHGSEDTI